MDTKSSGTGWRNAGPALLVCLWVVTTALTACSYVNRISGGPVSIRPAQDTAWLTGPRRSPSFEIPIVVRNASLATVNTDGCVIRAERFTDGIWELVFRPNCLRNSSPSIIHPGDSVTIQFVASAIADPSAAGRMIPGLYRAVVPVWTLDQRGNPVSLPQGERMSSTFIVAMK
jgi:hypothetical protein